VAHPVFEPIYAVAAHEPRAPISQPLWKQRDIWQGRFKSLPVQRDENLITVLRYVVQNPVRAGLASTTREWSWSSLRRPQLIDPCPMSDDEQSAEEIKPNQLTTLRECLNRQRPFGEKDLASRSNGDVRTREHAPGTGPTAN
jgi:hypothetical protein